MKVADLFRQKDYSARFEWGYEGVGHVGAASDVVVIVDVLSFTTCVDVVIGKEGVVFPYRMNDETARSFAREKQAILAGKRGRRFRFLRHLFPPFGKNPYRSSFSKWFDLYGSCKTMWGDRDCSLFAQCIGCCKIYSRQRRHRNGYCEWREMAEWNTETGDRGYDCSWSHFRRADRAYAIP